MSAREKSHQQKKSCLEKNCTKKIVPARKSCAKGKEVFAKWIQPQYDVVHVHLWC